MILTLRRTEFRDDGIFGELQGEAFSLATLEHSYERTAKIPDGTFKCVRGSHRLPWHVDKVDPRIGGQIVEVNGKRFIEFETFEITGVEGHSNLLFHWGNYQKDSEGCVLLGKRTAQSYNGEQMITDSRLAFSEFMQALQGVDEFQLVVT